MTLPAIQTNPITSEFGWNATAGRYMDLSTGRFVPFLEVRDALESVMGAARDNMNGLTERLIGSQISLAEWQTGMMQQIKLAHTAAAAAANGGWAQLSPSDWGAAGRMVRDQYDFLRNFAEQIADGTQPLDGRALVRADMYGEAARGTFESMHQRYEQLYNGMEEEIRLLGEADHCDGCLDQAALGWQPIGTLDDIGAEECLTKCHCTKKYRKMGPDGEWIESEDE
jgi:hypothetical protein